MLGVRVDNRNHNEFSSPAGAWRGKGYGSVCGMVEKGPMATHGIVGQGLGFPSRCGVRGCQVALLEDQRGRVHVKDTSEAYCPAMELLRVVFADMLHDPRLRGLRNKT